VDFEGRPAEDSYSAWQLILVLRDGDRTLVVEDAYDGDHIDIRINPRSQLESILSQATVPTLWKPYKMGTSDALSVLLQGKITQLQYAQDKPEFMLNRKLFKGNQSVYVGLKISCEQHSVTIFKSGEGLFVGMDSPLMPSFEDTYNWFQVR
jgi:hypothetical protein